VLLPCCAAVEPAAGCDEPAFDSAGDRPGERGNCGVAAAVIEFGGPFVGVDADSAIVVDGNFVDAAAAAAGAAASAAVDDIGVVAALFVAVGDEVAGCGFGVADGAAVVVVAAVVAAAAAAAAAAVV